jgi:non-ribosomal peptide synthetase component F
LADPGVPEPLAAARDEHGALAQAHGSADAGGITATQAESADSVAREPLRAAGGMSGVLAAADADGATPADPVVPEPLLADGRIVPPALPASAPDGVLARVRAAAAARPDAVAVADAGGGPNGGCAGRRTYAQLLADCARAAAAVRGAGVGPGDVLELRAARTADLAAALLGAWEAGAVVAVTDGGLPDAVLAGQRRLLRPGAVWTPGRGELPAPVTDPAPRALPGVGHVLFTSGTSGRPAAVKVPPGALAATLDWYTSAYGFTAADRVAMLGSLGHDPLLRDILAPLTVGGTVVVPPPDVFAAPDRLFALLREERVTVLHATPALLEMILAGRPRQEDTAQGPGPLPDLRLVVSAGAPLTAGLVRDLRTVTRARVVNAYGATETPQLASVHDAAAAGEPPPAGLPDAAVLPVGTGAGGAELLVLRPDGAPAPVGQVGEIVVRSPHLAAGYLGGTGRSGAFARVGGAAFRTGDRGRRDPRGAVVPDGRLDRQVSVDGHRLDPEQVERAALGHPGVHRAQARLLPTEAGTALSLSVAGHPGADAPALADLRSHLRRHLPRWAVPTELRVVDDIAADLRRKAAVRHAPHAPHASSATAPPFDVPLIDEMARLLRGVVGADVPRGASFFEAGLTSMALVRLHALLCERLATDFPVTAMFEHPNLTALARFLADGPRPVPSREVRHQPQGGERAHRRRQLRQRIRRDLERGQA